MGHAKYFYHITYYNSTIFLTILIKMNKKFLLTFLVISLCVFSSFAKEEKTKPSEDQIEEKLKSRIEDLDQKKERTKESGQEEESAKIEDDMKKYFEEFLKKSHEKLFDVRERTRAVAEETKKHMNQFMEELPAHWEEAKKKGMDNYGQIVQWLESFYKE